MSGGHGDWLRQGGWWSERSRSRPLYWPVGDPWFVNDPLGPLPHTHPDASEIFVVSQGAMVLTVGSRDYEVGCGDVVYVPPDTYHEPRAVGPDDLCLLALVTPNHPERRWKTSGFLASDFSGVPVILRAGSVDEVWDANVTCAVSVLAPGYESGWMTSAVDTLVMPLNGVLVAHTTHMEGTIPAGEYLNIMAENPYRLTAPPAEPVHLLTVRQGREPQREE